MTLDIKITALKIKTSSFYVIYTKVCVVMALLLTEFSSPFGFSLPFDLLLISQSFDWLAAFHLELLQANVFIAVQPSAPVFLATCFKYCSRGLPTGFFPDIAPSRMFTTDSLCVILCHIHEWRLFLKIFKSNLSSFFLASFEKLNRSLFSLSI